MNFLLLILVSFRSARSIFASPHVIPIVFHDFNLSFIVYFQYIQSDEMSYYKISIFFHGRHSMLAFPSPAVYILPRTEVMKEESSVAHETEKLFQNS